MSKWMLMFVLAASPSAAHAASESSQLSCGALTADKGQNDEENIKILARAIPEASAKHLTDVARKEWLKRGANDYAAFSASLDYYAQTALPLAQEVTAQFGLIAQQEGSYVNAVRVYCRDNKISISEFFRRAFDAALDDKLKKFTDDND